MGSREGERGRLLLIGARGFIGRATSDRFESAGWQVFSTAREPGEKYLECDLLDPSSLRRAIDSTKPDAIINAAGEASVEQSRSSPVKTMTVNATGVMSLLQATIESELMPYVLILSSATVYGVPDDSSPIREDHPIRPASPYAVSKATAESICDIYARSGGPQIGVARIFNQVGPGQSSQQAPAEFASAVAEAERASQTSVAVPVRAPEAARDFIDVRDTARAFQAMIDSGATGIFNVCTGKATRLGDLVRHLDEHSEVEVTVDAPTAPQGSGSGSPTQIFGSNERLRSLCGWSPRISLDKSMADLLEDRRRRLDSV